MAYRVILEFHAELSFQCVGNLAERGMLEYQVTVPCHLEECHVYAVHGTGLLCIGLAYLFVGFQNDGLLLGIFHADQHAAFFQRGLAEYLVGIRFDGKDRP